MPFAAMPESDTYFKTDGMDHWLGRLSQAINGTSSIHVVIGRQGAGKTALCRVLQRQFSAASEINTALFSELITIPEDPLGQAVSPNSTDGTSMDPQPLFMLTMQRALLKWAAEKSRMILLIDDGQNLPAPVLSQIVRFFHAVTDAAQEIHLVMFGENMLWQLLDSVANTASPDYQKLSLAPLTLREMHGLIEQQLQTAGCRHATATLFPPKSLRAIHRICEGNPGRIIEFCHLLMLTLFIRNHARVCWSVVQDCAWMLYRRRFLMLQGWSACGWVAAFATLALVIGLPQNRIHLLHSPRQEALPVTTELQTPPVPALSIVTAPEPSAPEPPAVDSSETPQVPSPITVNIQPPAGIESTATIIEPPRAPPEPGPAQEIFLLSLLQMHTTYGPEEVTVAPSSNREHMRNAPAPADSLLPARESPQDPVQGKPDPPAPEKPRQLSENRAPGRIKAPPAILGEMQLRKSETLGDIIRGIYGPYSFTPRNTRKVLAASPKIKDKHLLPIGTSVRLPAIAVVLPEQVQRLWWIELITTDTVQDAYRYLRIYQDKTPPLLIIPGWDDSGILRFHILLEEYFPDKDKAAARLDFLSAQLFPGKNIMAGLTRDKYYYKTREGMINGY